MKSPQLYRRPIDYFEAKRALDDISDYKLLLKCYMGSADEAERIKKLIPEYVDHRDRQKVKQKLQKLSVPMLHRFQRIGAPTDVHWSTSEREYDFEKNIPRYTKIKHKANIFTDQFATGHNKPTTYLETLDILEQAEGQYERIKERRQKQLFNPIFLVALILRMPLSIMEYMGVDTSSEHINRFVIWLIQSLVVILLLVLIARLGLDISYTDLVLHGNKP